VVSQLYPSHRGHDLAARSLNITAETPAATITQLLFTPWPIVLGQAVVSILLMAIELITMRTGSISVAKWAVIYTFNMIRGLGAVVWMVEDIEAGGKMPSVGVALIMAALCVSCVALPTTYIAFPQALGAIGHAVCLAGLGLYTASGILSVVHNGFLGRHSITMVVTMGCPDGLQYPDSIFDNTPLYCAALQPNYEFNDTLGSAVWLGFLWIMGLTIVFYVFWMWTFVFLFWCFHPSLLLSLFASTRTRSSANPRKMKRAAIWFAMGYTSIGAILATGAAAMMTGGAQESFLDCRNAQQQSYGYTGCNQTSISIPASPSGYFTTWSSYWEAIVRSMFVW
jgi:hypothetical protein